jgi:hypothetical protein
MKFAHSATRIVVVILLVASAFVVAAAAAAAQPPGPGARTTVTVSEDSAAGAVVPIAAAVSPVLFSEGFEGTLSQWQAQGSPTWGTTTYRAAAGQASAYCAQSAIPAPGPYADYMNAWLKAGPFDLSKVSAASLSYKMYLNSEEGLDSLLCLVSLNGSDWYGWSSSGAWAGWTDRSRNLASVITIGSVCGKSQVWIAFKFESDDSITGEGAYIDEVKLTDETPPSVTAMSPALGPVGSTVTLTGVGLAAATAVSFNGAPAQFTVDSAAQITATVPTGATSGPVTVSSPYGIGTSVAGFTVTVPPVISGFTPGKGVVGTSVTLTGANLDGATKVTFAGVSAAYRIDSPSQLTAVVPAGAQSGAIEVTTQGGVATSAASFIVTVKPQLLRLTPTSGKRGATLTLIGKDFGAKRGTGYVKFGSLKCTKFASWTATRIKCKVPAKAKFGKLKITVVTPGGTSAGKAFTVKR